MCYSNNIHHLFFIEKFSFLKYVLMGSDSTLVILKPTVKRGQTASVLEIITDGAIISVFWLK